MNTQETIGAVGALSNLVRSFGSSSPSSNSAPQGEDITEGAVSLKLQASSSSGASGGSMGVTNSAIKNGEWNMNSGSGDNGLSTKYIVGAVVVGGLLLLLSGKS